MSGTKRYHECVCAWERAWRPNWDGSTPGNKLHADGKKRLFNGFLMCVLLIWVSGKVERWKERTATCFFLSIDRDATKCKNTSYSWKGLSLESILLSLRFLPSSFLCSCAWWSFVCSFEGWMLDALMGIRSKLLWIKGAAAICHRGIICHRN